MKGTIGLIALGSLVMACSPAPKPATAAAEPKATTPTAIAATAPVPSAEPAAAVVTTEVSPADLAMVKSQPVNRTGDEAHTQYRVDLIDDVAPQYGHPSRRLAVDISLGQGDELFLACEDSYDVIGSHGHMASIGAVSESEGGPTASADYDGMERQLPVPLTSGTGWHAVGTREAGKRGDQAFAQILAFFKIVRAGKNVTVGHRRDFADPADSLGQLIRYCESM